MSEQLLPRRTVHAWLALVAAMQSLDDASDEGALGALVGQCPLPVAVIDIKARDVVVMSPRMRQLLAVEADHPRPLDLYVVVEDPALRDGLFDLMVTGAIDAYEARRRLRRGDAVEFEAQVWVAVLDETERRHAVWVATPIGVATPDVDDDHELTASEWPARVAGMVVGEFDATWTIARASVDVESLLGRPLDEIVGAPLVDLVHRDDLAEVYAATARALVERGAVDTAARMRGHNGEWVPGRLIITPLAGEALRFGFAYTVASDGASLPSDRTADLERRLWRIAREVEASGVVRGFETIHPEPAMPGLEDLSSRQWEVLTRLLRGQRVPAMSRELYLSQSTIRNHLTALFRRFGVHSQSELVELVRTGAGSAASG